jgi:hypothetical protein
MSLIIEYCASFRLANLVEADSAEMESMSESDGSSDESDFDLKSHAASTLDASYTWEILHFLRS